MAMEAADDQSEIFGLIREVGKARELANAADEVEHAIFTRGDRPELPFVKSREIPYPFRGFERDELNTAREIEKLFDRYAASRHRHFEWLAEACEGGVLPPQHQAALDRQLQDVEKQRYIARALYSEREAAYDNWKELSGHLAAEAESDKRWSVAWALESRIIQFPCTTLEEVAAKARYIVAEYGSDYAREKQHAFIAEVAGLIETKEVV